MIPSDVLEHLTDDVGDDPVYVLAHLYCLQKHAVDLWVMKHNNSGTPFFKPNSKQAKSINELLLDIRVEYSKMKPEFPFLFKFSHEVLKNGTARLHIDPQYTDLLEEALEVIKEGGGPNVVQELH